MEEPLILKQQQSEKETEENAIISSVARESSPMGVCQESPRFNPDVSPMNRTHPLDSGALNSVNATGLKSGLKDTLQPSKYHDSNFGTPARTIETFDQQIDAVIKLKPSDADR